MLHFTWTWAPDTPTQPPSPNQDLPETETPDWRLLLNRTAEGATSQDTLELEASTCQATTGSATGTSATGSTTGSAMRAQAYCAEIACPGPGAYVVLLQAANEAGASEPSNVRSFGLGPACEVISYDAALAQALTVERDAPTTPPGGPVAGGPPPSTGTTPPNPGGTPPTPGTTPTPGPGTTPPTAGGPQLGEPTSGPPVADNRPTPNPDGSPTRPEPPDPLEPPTGAEGTIAERDAENLKTYEAAQETARKTYQDVLAKYETLRKQPGAKPAEVQKAYEAVVKGYGTATQGLMESYRTALTEYSELFVEWTEEKAEGTKPGDTPTSADATTPANGTPPANGATPPDAAKAAVAQATDANPGHPGRRRTGADNQQRGQQSEHEARGRWQQGSADCAWWPRNNDHDGGQTGDPGRHSTARDHFTSWYQHGSHGDTA